MSENYEEFADRMEKTYPEMLGQPYGGFAVGEGWFKILEALLGNIDLYTKGNQSRVAWCKENGAEPPTEVPQVVVRQIKEKFGGLRFYYVGGDEYISGMVRMAESWASKTCEVCGEPGKSRSGWWIQTLCDKHDAERSKAK